MKATEDRKEAAVNRIVSLAGERAHTFRKFVREVIDDLTEVRDTPAIRPIGELPVGTEIRYIEGEKAGIPFGWDKAMTQNVRYVGPNNTCRSTPEGGTRSNLPPHHRVRVIAYPDGYQDGTPEPNEDVVRMLESAGCVDPETTQFLVTPKLVDGRSARSVIDELKKSKPHLFQKPEPTAMEQLPEAVREFIQGMGLLSVWGIDEEVEREALARVILDNAPEIFAAGEPVEALKLRDCVDDWIEVCSSESKPGCVWVSSSGVWLIHEQAKAMAKRLIALAARKNAQGDAS